MKYKKFTYNKYYMTIFYTNNFCSVGGCDLACGGVDLGEFFPRGLCPTSAQKGGL